MSWCRTMHGSAQQEAFRCSQIQSVIWHMSWLQVYLSGTKKATMGQPHRILINKTANKLDLLFSLSFIQKGVYCNTNCNTFLDDMHLLKITLPLLLCRRLLLKGFIALKYLLTISRHLYFHYFIQNNQTP